MSLTKIGTSIQSANGTHYTSIQSANGTQEYSSTQVY